MSKKAKKVILPFLLILFLIPLNKMIISTDSSFETSDETTFEAELPIIIDDDSDFGPSGYNFPGSGTEMEPYIIEGYNIEAQTVDDIGISVKDTTMNFEIKNNDIDIDSALENLAYIGILVVNVSANTAKIINNHVVWYGAHILVIDSEGVIVKDNTIERVGNPGIWIENCPHASVENNIIYSIFLPTMKESKSSETNMPSVYTAKHFGIYLVNSSDSNITGNNIDLDTEIKGGGISVQYSSRVLIDENKVTNLDVPYSEFEYLEKGGLYLVSVKNSTVFKNIVERTDKCNIYSTSCDKLLIANNTLSESEETGIAFYSTTNSTIIHNIIQNHPSFGVEITIDSENNVIHHNHFKDNNIGGSQGSDSGYNNTWYDMGTLEGNWWNTWTGGDYIIDGTAGSVDSFPLGEPVPVPEFSEAMVVSMLLLPVSILAVLIIKRRKSK